MKKHVKIIVLIIFLIVVLLFTAYRFLDNPVKEYFHSLNDYSDGWFKYVFLGKVLKNCIPITTIHLLGLVLCIPKMFFGINNRGYNTIVILVLIGIPAFIIGNYLKTVEKVNFGVFLTILLYIAYIFFYEAPAFFVTVKNEDYHRYGYSLTSEKIKQLTIEHSLEVALIALLILSISPGIVLLMIHTVSWLWKMYSGTIQFWNIIFLIVFSIALFCGGSYVVVVKVINKK